MKKFHLILLAVILCQIAVILMRYLENGGFKAQVLSRVHKLENGFRDGVREIEEKHDVNSVQSWIKLGELYTTFALMPEAEYCFRRALDVGDLNLTQKFKFGICLSRRGKIAKAIKVLKPVGASKDELASHANLQIGLDYLRLEDRVNAEIYLRKTKDDEIADLALARILIRDERAKEAVEILSRLLERSPNSMRAHQMQGWAYEKLGNQQEARHSFDLSMHTSEMITIHPISRDWDQQNVNKMGAAVALKSSTEALEADDTDTATREAMNSFKLLEPLWRPAYGIQASLSFLKSGDPETALFYLKRWLIHDGESAYLWELVGDCFLASEDEAKAEAAWLRGQVVRASKTVEANAECCRKLSELYASQGNTAKAELYRGYHKYESGRLQWRDNKIREANVELSVAVSILKDDPNVWFALAEAQRALSDRTAAKQSYEECLQRSPNHGRAIVGLELVK
ncbi:MAG: hypothetical protein CMJ76_02560 [Planctomycetaceae bacterium]|nr:hypothetical protein [Planctomycetaceae bacterium]|tara:strand:- start:562 stop:1932 length:1371 start_codon:yes stop_codon:yes gene_type:complete